MDSSQYSFKTNGKEANESGGVPNGLPLQVADHQQKRYRPSRFNAHTTDEDGALILYNTFTGHRCVIPAKSVSFIAPYLSQKGVQYPLDSLGSYLLRKGYIVDDATDEDAIWDVRYGLQQFRTDVLQLILLASEECNFRCGYCSQHFRRGTMLADVREGVRNLVKSCVKRLSHLQISWFGGEPLLGYDAIEELAPFFYDIALQQGVAYRSDITTNGYLLTPERSRKLVRWGIRDYQITLDGPPEEHNARRPFKNGGPTFEQIIDNIAAMKEDTETFSVVIRINFDHSNVHKADKLFTLLQTRLGSDHRFTMRFCPVRRWGGPGDKVLTFCDSREIVLFDHELAERSRSFGLTLDQRRCRRLDPEGIICYAARPYNYIIGADGKVMKCQVVLDTVPANIVGVLSRDGHLNLDENLFAKWVRPYYRDDSMCSRCFFLPACQGAQCPLHRISPGNWACPGYKTDIQNILRFARKEQSTEREMQPISIGVPQDSEPPQTAYQHS